MFLGIYIWGRLIHELHILSSASSFAADVPQQRRPINCIQDKVTNRLDKQRANGRQTREYLGCGSGCPLRRLWWASYRLEMKNTCVCIYNGTRSAVCPFRGFCYFYIYIYIYLNVLTIFTVRLVQSKVLDNIQIDLLRQNYRNTQV